MHPRGVLSVSLRVVGALLILFAFRKFFELWLMAKGIISEPSAGYPANDVIFAIAGAALIRYADRIANLKFRK